MIRKASTTRVDKITKRWIRNASDEKAVAKGCRFDEARGQFVIDWCAKYLKLYEGDHAGEALIMRDWQIEATMRMFGWVRYSERWNRKIRRFTRASIWIPKKNKKNLALDTPIPTPNGWTSMGDLVSGSQVFDEHGNTCNVTNVTDVFPSDDCYRLSFSDGTSIVAGATHEWFVQRTTNKRKWVTCETEEMFRTQSTGADRRANYRVHVNGAIECGYSDLPIDPYLLGIWLGDGSSSKGEITIAHGEEAILDDLKQYRVSRNVQNGSGSSNVVHLPGFVTDLKTLNLYKNKHIPAIYLRGTIDQRFALLQGLMDSDGCAGPKGQCIFVTILDSLKDGMLELLRSLGFKPTAHQVETRCQTGAVGTCWRVLFSADADSTVFRLNRKQRKLPDARCKTSRSRTKTIVSIERVASVPTRCITVDSPSHLFLAGKGMIPTHNSPTLAAWGLYLLCGDGEDGQKVFFAAKDGQQARDNCGKHCIEMVMASEELMAECTINKSRMQITHEPSRSILLPLSSSNARTEKSKEGLNGSIMIDETHVVDRQFVNRLTRAGASRSEPFHIEVSTAGDDPESYGRTQYEWGKLVESGEQEDQNLFFLCYEAPQTLSDTELAKDPVKYGKLANAAWGHTIGQEEYLADYNRSKASLGDLAEFKMYRLNIWQAASNPAIRPEDWRANQENFLLSELEGKHVYAGLDLGFKWDPSALALLFPWDERDGEPEFRLLTYFWLPDFTAHKERSQVRWLDWERRGDLKIIPDSNINDFPAIKRFILEVADKYNLQKLVYDERFAQTMCQELQDDHGLDILNFKQNAPNYNEPCRMFEKFVIDRRIHHRGNKCMDWMIGNLTFRENKINEAILPTKPDNNRIGRVDGPVATIMALHAALEDQCGVSIYNEPGNLFL